MGVCNQAPVAQCSNDMLEIEAALNVADLAADLVALWENPNIAGLPRAERNAAIDGVRTELIAAVGEWREAKARSE